jgi:hypothetical protein
MREYIAFQQFIPKEHQGDKRCIWCGKEKPRNRAHIISKKLTLAPHNNIVLKYSVCQSCNSKCGQIENWILRNSPLGWTRFFHYWSSNKESDSGSIPSYFYAEDEHEWLVYRLEGRKRVKTIDSQLILKQDGQLILITEQPESLLDMIRGQIRIGNFIPDLRLSLPDDFSPRALVNKGQVIVVARTQEEIDSIIETICSNTYNEISKNRVQLKRAVPERQHFKWSRENWIRLCAKISFETLCLFEGPGYCLKSDFNKVRSFVLAGASSDYREIIFDEHGPQGFKDIPNTQGCIDMTQGQNCPRDFFALLPHISPGMHNVILYEVEGWVCSSISISGFPACCIVLGGPNVHLKDLYIFVYDDQADEFDTVCLAYDRNKPVIPLPIQGKMREKLLHTYKLGRGQLIDNNFNKLNKEG